MRNNLNTSKQGKRQSRFPKRVFRFMLSCWQRITHANRYYMWYVFSRMLSQAWQKQLESHYTGTAPSPSEVSRKENKQVIFICNGTLLSGGLADRLKGIISTYILCKEQGWQFKLLFTDPFPLELFLVPNTYDWVISEAEVRYDRTYSTPIALEISEESTYQAHKQKAWLHRQIAKASTPQVHIYTNAMFAYHDDFSTAFNELFRPSERLQQHINSELEALHHSYVSISARFLNVLGDFTDTAESLPLPEQEQHELLNRCLHCIERCHELHPGRLILVNSDSLRFLNEAKALPYVYTVDGTITHLDTECTAASSLYERYEKTMLDYLLISTAESIYRIDGKWLHTSGYPLSASKIHNRPFITLNPRP